MGEDVHITDAVEVMLGDTKKALIAMAIPIVITNLVQCINNMIDGVWLTSIGINAQTAVNATFPFFFILIGISNGIGIGASQAIARRIGAMDRKGANAVASQAFVLAIVISIAFAIIFTEFAEPLLLNSGGKTYIDDCLAYAIPIFLGAPVIFLAGIFSALLRSEGAARRSMNINVAGAAMNIVLDPIFIFVFGMGISGAAIATVISMFIPLIFAFFWYFGRQDTFIRIPLKKFRFDKVLDADIFRVGIPAAMELVLISIAAMFMNMIISGIDPLNGVAIYGNGWKLVDLFMMPTMAFGFAIVPICAAALGAKKPYKIHDTYWLSMKYSIICMLCISAILVIFAKWLVIPFSYSEETSAIAGQMALFVSLCAIFLPFCPLGYTSSGYFQSMGWGMKSLSILIVINFTRVPICYLLGLSGDLTFVWYGVVISEIAGSVFGGIWGFFSMRKLMDGGYPELIRKEEYRTD